MLPGYGNKNKTAHVRALSYASLMFQLVDKLLILYVGGSDN